MGKARDTKDVIEAIRIYATDPDHGDFWVAHLEDILDSRIECSCEEAEQANSLGDPARNKTLGDLASLHERLDGALGDLLLADFERVESLKEAKKKNRALLSSLKMKIRVIAEVKQPQPWPDPKGPQEEVPGRQVKAAEASLASGADEPNKAPQSRATSDPHPKRAGPDQTTVLPPPAASLPGTSPDERDARSQDTPSKTSATRVEAHPPLEAPNSAPQPNTARPDETTVSLRPAAALGTTTPRAKEPPHPEIVSAGTQDGRPNVTVTTIATVIQPPPLLELPRVSPETLLRERILKLARSAATLDDLEDLEAQVKNRPSGASSAVLHELEAEVSRTTARVVASLGKAVTEETSRLASEAASPGDLQALVQVGDRNSRLLDRDQSLAQTVEADIERARDRVMANRANVLNQAERFVSRGDLGGVEDLLKDCPGWNQELMPFLASARKTQDFGERFATLAGQAADLKGIEDLERLLAGNLNTLLKPGTPLAENCAAWLAEAKDRIKRRLDADKGETAANARVRRDQGAISAPSDAGRPDRPEIPTLTRPERAPVPRASEEQGKHRVVRPASAWQVVKRYRRSLIISVVLAALGAAGCWWLWWWLHLPRE
jgi:hypothetical protein